MSLEKTLDIAFASELESSSDFVQWLLRQTRFAGEAAILKCLRSNWPWGKAKLRVWNEDTESYESITREGETDILAVFQSKRRGRFALHIENKLSNGAFTKLQPEVYRARAAAWVGKEKYGDYEEWETVLIAPKAFFVKNEYECRKFDRYVSHEEIAAYIPAFGQAGSA